MLADDSVTDAEPQAGALSHFLGGEERIEDALRMSNAFAVVAEQDLQPAAVVHCLNLNHARPAGGADRVISVVEDVEENLLQLVRVAGQLRQAFIKFLHDLDAVVGEIIGAQRDSLAQDAVDLEHLAHGRALPGKAEKVLHALFGALGLFQNHLQVFARASRNLRILHEQIRKTHDGGERVVHLVGHAGDKLAHRSHLLRVHQFGLDHGGIGNVRHQHHHAADVAAFVAHGTQVDGELARGAVAAHNHQVQVVCLQAMQAGLKGFGKGRLVQRRNDVVQAVSHQLVLVETTGLIAAAVGITDQAGGVRYQNHGLGVVQDLAGKVALPLKLRLEVLHFGDIQEDTALLHGFSLAIAYDDDGFQHVDPGAGSAAESHFKIPDGAVFVQLAEDFVALLRGDINLGLQVQLEDFLAGLVAQHAHQSIVHLDEMAFWRSKKDAFLHVVKQLAIAALGLAAVGDVLEHMHGLQSLFQSTVKAAAGNQIRELQAWMI